MLAPHPSEGMPMLGGKGSWVPPACPAERDGGAQEAQPGWARVFLRLANLELCGPHATASPTGVAGVDLPGRQGGMMRTSTLGLVLLHPLCPRCI